MATKPDTGPAPTLRGDYSRAGADYTVDQEWQRYTPHEHAIWRFLYRRQVELVHHYACEEFIGGVQVLDSDEAIPRFEDVSRALAKRTGWRIVAVPGLVPDDVFFGHLAARRFPVTRWIRTAAEVDYLVEPDVFHDLFGHIPLLSNKVFADYLQLYGECGKEALLSGGLHMLARLYWYTVEFGLLEAAGGIKAYGAGILSSAGETRFAVESAKPNRIRFDAERVMRTQYRIDDYQKTYFVLRSLDQLFDAIRSTSFPDLYRRFRDEDGIGASAILSRDEVIHVGTGAIWAGER
jgi:phenylalanine-4-hydroxylase